jgi:hypothetical protein
MSPPCKEVADGKAKGAIIHDEKTGAVIFTSKVKMKPEDFKEVREACPYDIPRISGAGIMAKCTMCFDRIKEGRFEDTNKLFVPPEKYDYRVTSEPFDYVSHHADEIERLLKRPRNLKKVA